MTRTIGMRDTAARISACRFARYYYINAEVREQFLSRTEREDTPRDVIFDDEKKTMIFVHVNRNR